MVVIPCMISIILLYICYFVLLINIFLGEVSRFCKLYIFRYVRNFFLKKKPWMLYWFIGWTHVLFLFFGASCFLRMFQVFGD